MAPCYGGDFPQQLNRFLVAGGLIAFQQLREQNRVVGNDNVGDQPGDWLLIAMSRSVRPASCFLPPTWAIADRS